MYPYRKPQIDIFMDLVKEANPGITLPVNTTTIALTAPVAQTVVAPKIADTNITIYGKDETWLGRKKVEYRRLDIASEFKGMQTPLEVSVYSATASTTVADFFEALNTKYGTNFGQADWPWVGTTPISYDTQFAWVVPATSLCYKGSLNLMARKAKRSLSTAIPGVSVPGRLYQGGNAFPGNRKPQGEYVCYAADCSSVITASFGQGQVQTTGWGNVFPYLRSLGYTDLDNTKPPTQFGGVLGCLYSTVALPNPTYPEANSDKYKYAVVITPPSSGECWFQGRLILHTNF